MFKRIGRVLKHRVFVTCFATAMVFFSMTAMSVPTSSALPGASSETDYFTDGTFTNQCGIKIITCHGQMFRSGCITNFKIVTTEECP